MISDMMKRIKEERKAASRFTEGVEVAVVFHHWSRHLERKARVARVHKTGNFTITNADGTPGDQQWRPNDDRATEAGAGRAHSSHHLEVWTPAHDRELADARREGALRKRREEYVKRLEAIRDLDALAAVLDAMRDTLPPPM